MRRIDALEVSRNVTPARWMNSNRTQTIVVSARWTDVDPGKSEPSRGEKAESFPSPVMDQTGYMGHGGAFSGCESGKPRWVNRGAGRGCAVLYTSSAGILVL